MVGVSTGDSGTELKWKYPLSGQVLYSCDEVEREQQRGQKVLLGDTPGPSSFRHSSSRDDRKQLWTEIYESILR